MYRHEIINDGKLYHRFVNDFFSSHLVIGSNKSEDWNIHLKNILSIKELLEQRQDLVREYFTQSFFEKKECEEMIHSFNYGTINKKVVNKELGVFSDRQLHLITDFVNKDFDTQKKSIFSRVVTFDEIRDLFQSRLNIPLKTGANVSFALFMDSLSTHNFLCHSYQTLILEYGLIQCSSSDNYYGGNALSVSITKAKNGKHYIDNPYDSFVKELVKCAENDR